MRLNIIAYLVLLFSVSLQAQKFLPLDNAQSQIYLNPSFAGSNGHIRNQLIYLQRPESDRRSCGFNNSFDAFVPSLSAGISAGGSYYNRMNGRFKTTVGSLGYAQYFHYNGLNIIPSLNLVSSTEIIDTSAFGPGYFRYASDMPQVQRGMTAGAGLLLNYKKLYFGASAIGISRKQSLNPPQPMLILHLSYNIFMHDNARLNLQLRYQDERNRESIVSGVNALLYRHFIVGACYNTSQAGYFNLGFNAQQWLVQAGYQVTGGQDNFRNGHTFNLMVSINLRKNTQSAEKLNLESF